MNEVAAKTVEEFRRYAKPYQDHAADAWEAVTRELAKRPILPSGPEADAKGEANLRKKYPSDTRAPLSGLEILATPVALPDGGTTRYAARPWGDLERAYADPRGVVEAAAQSWLDDFGAIPIGLQRLLANPDRTLPLKDTRHLPSGDGNPDYRAGYWPSQDPAQEFIQAPLSQRSGRQGSLIVMEELKHPANWVRFTDPDVQAYLHDWVEQASGGKWGGSYRSSSVDEATIGAVTFKRHLARRNKGVPVSRDEMLKFVDKYYSLDEAAYQAASLPSDVRRELDYVRESPELRGVYYNLYDKVAEAPSDPATGDSVTV